MRGSRQRGLLSIATHLLVLGRSSDFRPAHAVEQSAGQDSHHESRKLSGVALVNEVCSQLPRICSVLDLASEHTAVPSSRFCRPTTAMSLEIFGLLAMLAKTGHPAVFEAAEVVQVLPRCLR